jgi:pilus assembly protein CpaC
MTARPIRTFLSWLGAFVLAIAPLPSVAQSAPEGDGVQMLRITQGGIGARHDLVLALNKAAIVDLPADARDVLLSNPEIADAVVRTARRVYVIGRKIGMTNAFFFDAQGRQIANLEIRVEPDVGPLNALLRRHAPESSAKAESINGSLVLSGSVRSASEAERVLQIANRFVAASSGGGGQGAGAAQNPQIVNLLSVEGQEQVLVKVRVVEMSRTLVRQLGVNLNAENIINQFLPEDTFVRVATQNGYSIAGRSLGGLNAGGGVVDNVLVPQTLATGSLFAGVDPSTFANAAQLDPRLAGVGGFAFSPANPPSQPFNQFTFGPGRTVANDRIDATIEAFERVGLLRVLAEPNLTAISGEAAKFLAGGEFPVPVQQDDGKVSVEFKPFGVGLAFTPVVLSGGRISIKLSTEVSELTSEGAFSTGDTTFIDANNQRQIIRGLTIPALQVRRAETTVEMPSGGAIMMAGLIQERTRQAIEGIPGAKDLPVFGSLFRSRDFINNETELVILVTPYLVKAGAPGAMRSPADGFRNANETETLLNGRLNAIYAAPTGQSPQGRLNGPHGHVLN